MRRQWWCLREGDWDGGVEQVEGAALEWRGGGELVDGSTADGDGVAGERSEMVEQVAEAADGLVVGVGFAGGFGLGGG